MRHARTTARDLLRACGATAWTQGRESLYAADNDARPCTTCCDRMSSSGSGVTRGPASPTGPGRDGGGEVSVAGGERDTGRTRGHSTCTRYRADSASPQGACSRRATEPRARCDAATLVPQRCVLSSDGRGQGPMRTRDPSHDGRLPARSSAETSRWAPVHGGVIRPAASTHRQASLLVRADNAVA
jgi:hypothetical protein